MILLLDTHALLWALADPSALRPEARESIASPANDVLVSAASVWEIAIKRGLGKLQAPADIGGAVTATNFVGLPITLADADAAGALPLLHRDPFDRMLVAQARRVGAVIVTADPVFATYGVEVLRA